jgi:hypothetical protein
MIERKSVCKPRKAYLEYVRIVTGFCAYQGALLDAGPKARRRFARLYGFKVSELPVTPSKRKG